MVSADSGMNDTSVELVIEPRNHDLGGFEVRRVLPYAKRRMVGPFIFVDHFGPSEIPAGQGVDVRPHPHIGLATITYLFEGSIVHRDSLGVVKTIEPEAVNWMTAGRGIVHSERSDPERRKSAQMVYGMQTWVALPTEHEEVEPAFAHTPANEIPQVDQDGCRLRVIAGSFAGATSPVATLSPLFYVEARLEAGVELTMEAAYEERAVYIVEGALDLEGSRYEENRMLVLRPNGTVSFRAAAPSRLMLLGGAPLEGKRHIWWNFVSSRPERIEQAKADWREGRFEPVPGETEFIPLPEGP